MRSPAPAAAPGTHASRVLRWPGAGPSISPTAGEGPARSPANRGAPAWTRRSLRRLAWALVVVPACAGPGDPAAPPPAPVPDATVGPETRAAPARPPIYLTDATGLLGLQRRRIAGVSMVDWDTDGWPDITLADMGGPRLFHNRGDGTFVDVTAASGIGAAQLKSARAVVWADLDGDGDLDLFFSVTGDADRLFWNRGDGTFEDGSGAAGIDAVRMSEGASVADLDGDGYLDIFVSAIPRRDDPPTGTDIGDEGRNLLYHNNGDGTFVEVSGEAGVRGPPEGFSFGAVIFDIDDDGDQDIFVVHDFDPDQVFLNDGSGHFVDRGQLYLGGHDGGLMGMDVGDIFGRGLLDIYATNWGTDMLLARGKPLATSLLWDMLGEVLGAGLNTSAATTGWGCALADLDNDADLDVITVSSFSDGTRKRRSFLRDGQIMVLQNQGLGMVPGGLVDVSEAALADRMYLNGFGLAAADFDRDGDVDVLAGVDDAFNAGRAGLDESTIRFTSLLLRNDSGTARANGFITLTLRQPGPNRFAVGARVDVEVGGRRTGRVVLAGASYLSSSSYDLHFGLGGALRADRITITWPGGDVQELHDWPPGFHTVDKGQAAAPCCWFQRTCGPRLGGRCRPPRPAPTSPEVCRLLCDGARECPPHPRLAEFRSGDTAACLEDCAVHPLDPGEDRCVEQYRGCDELVACFTR